MADLKTSVQFIHGIGPQRAKALEKLGIATLGDLISWFPRRYEDRTQIVPIAQLDPDTPACVAAMIAAPPTLSHIRKGMDLVKVRAVDDTGMLEVTFFNQTWLKNQLHEGETYLFYGRAEGNLLRRRMTSPVVEPIGRREFTGRIVPIYPLTAGVSQLILSRSIRQGLDACTDILPDALPDEVRQAHHLCRINYAYENIHFPEREEALALARRRLAFEELFFFTIGLQRLRRRREVVHVEPFSPVDMDGFYHALPFSLTGAQRRCVDEALSDMVSGVPMNRLCQGDVGSGKTMVAAACAYFCVKNGRQAALMAPCWNLWASGATCSPAPPPPGKSGPLPRPWPTGKWTFSSAPTPSLPGTCITPTWDWWSPTSSTASAWPSGRPWPPRVPIPIPWSCPPRPFPGPWP